MIRNSKTSINNAFFLIQKISQPNTNFLSHYEKTKSPMGTEETNIIFLIYRTDNIAAVYHLQTISCCVPPT